MWVAQKSVAQMRVRVLGGALGTELSLLFKCRSLKGRVAQVSALKDNGNRNRHQPIPSHIAYQPPERSPSRSSTKPSLVRATKDFKAREADELSLETGDVISLIGKRSDGWYKGKLRDQEGLFPGNFVEEI
ncbi:unnamed protein product [Didymodactylos carnosus]|uniref:SH3 domain-containing protein n=1 Tax=Didymodactylos carnosus TaxID=1234261 RepID=A0A815D9X7_9BILA|nr:unnamed protein product [Didymodactylos carnosus]CAF1295139.1 unnamed protein product [Didymodactylos carnosus]CAF4077745.1 unnamed protein product [Didymodactylos carnosus]CAF4108362.1 unnamed protein product [Didymodactylos carnosus]